MHGSWFLMFLFEPKCYFPISCILLYLWHHCCMSIHPSYHLVPSVTLDEDTTTWVTTISSFLFIIPLSLIITYDYHGFWWKSLCYKWLATCLDILWCLIFVFIILNFFIFFVPCIFISKYSHFPFHDIFVFHLSLVFMSFISVSIILLILSIFMLTLRHHLAMWCASISMLIFFSFLIYFLLS